MSHFTGRLILEPASDERTFRLHESFAYESDLLGFRVTIPQGFVTDGASVPRIFWSIIPPLGIYGRAAVVHDYLYRWQRTCRQDADDTLLEAMWVCKTGWFDLLAIWIAVRLFGCFAWKKDSRNPLSPADLAPNENIAARLHAASS